MSSKEKTSLESEGGLGAYLPERDPPGLARKTGRGPCIRSEGCRAFQGSPFGLERNTLLCCCRGPFCRGKAIRFPNPPCGIVS
jgi:hypothetical protein